MRSLPPSTPSFHAAHRFHSNEPTHAATFLALHGRRRAFRPLLSLRIRIIRSIAARSYPSPRMQAPILLDDGWRQINEYGLKKLFKIIETGSLQEQTSQAGGGSGGGFNSMRAAANDGSASSSSSSSSGNNNNQQQGFTNEEYAKLYTSVSARAMQIEPRSGFARPNLLRVSDSTFPASCLFFLCSASSIKCAFKKPLTAGHHSSTNDTIPAYRNIFRSVSRQQSAIECNGGAGGIRCIARGD